MTKAKMLGGALVGMAMALGGCAGGGSSVGTADLEQDITVDSSLDGRTDLFLDPTLSSFLLTADEVNGSPTAVPVEIEITSEALIAWRAQNELAPELRSRTAADMVARFEIVSTSEGLDVGPIQTVGNETHPGDDGPVTVPGGLFYVGDRLGRGTRGGTGTNLGTIPLPSFSLTIHIGGTGGIPDTTDIDVLNGIRNAHPGCA
ncbi:MAG: hypothetical protein U0234_11920 [Sandaracinus sp.]